MTFHAIVGIFAVGYTALLIWWVWFYWMIDHDDSDP